jgi:hypothetical protein
MERRETGPQSKPSWIGKNGNLRTRHEILESLIVRVERISIAHPPNTCSNIRLITSKKFQGQWRIPAVISADDVATPNNKPGTSEPPK